MCFVRLGLGFVYLGLFEFCLWGCLLLGFLFDLILSAYWCLDCLLGLCLLIYWPAGCATYYL